MSIKYKYKYKISICFANTNTDVLMVDILDELNIAKERFNVRSPVSKNAKRIESLDVKDTILEITLLSSEPLTFLLKALTVFTQEVITLLKKTDEKQNLLSKVVKKKCLFSLVDSKLINYNEKINRTKHANINKDVLMLMSKLFLEEDENLSDNEITVKRQIIQLLLEYDLI